MLVVMFLSGDKPRLRLDPEPQIPGKLGKSHKPYSVIGQRESNYAFDSLPINRGLSGCVKYVIRSGLEYTTRQGTFALSFCTGQ